MWRSHRSVPITPTDTPNLHAGNRRILGEGSLEDSLEDCSLQHPRSQGDRHTTTAPLVVGEQRYPVLCRCQLGQDILIYCGARTADPFPLVGGVGMDRVRTKHAVPPRRGPVTTTRQGNGRHTLRSDRIGEMTIRPGPTRQYAVHGTGTRSLPEAARLNFGPTKGLSAAAGPDCRRL